MALSEEEVKELGRLLAARMGEGRLDRPKLRLITPPRPTLLDGFAREARLKRIRHLQRGYNLTWLVDQATFNVVALSLLEDDALVRLHSDMERARECVVDGISFEDAGLVRDPEAADRDVRPERSGTSRCRFTRESYRQAEIAEIGADRMVADAALDVSPTDAAPF